jgi:hypothetical protein
MKQRPVLATILLVAVAVDTLVYGGWAVAAPDDLLARLDVAGPTVKWKFLGKERETSDPRLLWRAMGVLFLAQAAILAIAAWRPGALGALVFAPLLGRLLPLGVWLWLLGQQRVQLSTTTLWLLIIHDGLCVLLLTAFLLGSRRSV